MQLLADRNDAWRLTVLRGALQHQLPLANSFGHGHERDLSTKPTWGKLQHLHTYNEQLNSAMNVDVT